MATQRRHSLPAADSVQVRRHDTSSVLAEENAQLERKLRQLREAMQKEMQKRDEVRRTLTAGAIWNSARPGPLQQITRDLTGSLAPSTGPRKAALWTEYAASGYKTSKVPDFRMGIGPRRPPAKLPPLSPKRASESSARPAERPSSGQSAGEQPVSQDWEHRNRPGAPKQQNVEPGGSLLDGDFDEERNRASFAEALRAWRSGDASTSGAHAEAEEAPGSSRRRPQSARPATPAVCMEVQTERPVVRPATARPRTARPRTYFEKLAERRAGQLASQAVQRAQQGSRGSAFAAGSLGS